MAISKPLERHSGILTDSLSFVEGILLDFIMVALLLIVLRIEHLPPIIKLSTPQVPYVVSNPRRTESSFFLQGCPPIPENQTLHTSGPIEQQIRRYLFDVLFKT